MQKGTIDLNKSPRRQHRKIMTEIMKERPRDMSNQSSQRTRVKKNRKKHICIDD